MEISEKKPFVGFHTRFYDHGSVDKFIDFIQNHLAPMEFNALIVEVCGYSYRCFPQYAAGNLTFEDLRKIADACREVGITPIPLVQSLSHQGDPLPLYRDHPELLETEIRPADAEWSDYYGYSWCASNDTIYDYMFPMMDEIIEAFQADIVHVGLDEVFDIGEECCPRCAGKDKAMLFARTVKILHDHLAEQGKRMMMWGDRLLDAETLGYNMWEADVFGMYPAFDRLEEVTRDIIIADWHYERTAFNFPSVKQFMQGGFTVIPALGTDIDQCKDFWKYCLEYIYLGRKFHWPGQVGGVLFTYWSDMTNDNIDLMIAGLEGRADAKNLPLFHPTAEGAIIAAIEPRAKYLKK